MKRKDFVQQVRNFNVYVIFQQVVKVRILQTINKKKKKLDGDKGIAFDDILSFIIYINC